MSRREHASQWSDGAAGPLLNMFDEMTEPDGVWQELALCAETDPEIFFPEKGHSTREAKLVCRYCDVRERCLEYALEHDERFGIWGGMSERDRRVLKMTRRKEAA
jgi:WhiB family transcriptional regulator, redox-sensing transcriptional regulator